MTDLRQSSRLPTFKRYFTSGSKWFGLLCTSIFLMIITESIIAEQAGRRITILFKGGTSVSDSPYKALNINERRGLKNSSEMQEIKIDYQNW